MENCDIEEPSSYWTMEFDEDPYKEKPMPEFAESLKITGPWRSGPPNNPKTMFELVTEDGLIVADVYHQDPKEARRLAILLAAAPSLADALQFVAESLRDRGPIPERRIGNTWVESQGTPCVACDEPGQPSRMVFSGIGRAYHPQCVPESVKQELAEMEKADAKREDTDVQF